MRHRLTMQFPVPLTTFAPLKHGARALEARREAGSGGALHDRSNVVDAPHRKPLNVMCHSS